MLLLLITAPHGVVPAAGTRSDTVVASLMTPPNAAQIIYDIFCVRIDNRNAGLVVRLSLGRDQTLRFPLDHEYLATAPAVRQPMVSTLTPLNERYL